MAKPLTDDERQAIIDLCHAGKSQREIVQISRRSNGTVSKIAQSIGHRFGQSNLSHAHEARASYAAERRAVVAAKALERATELLTDFDATQPVLVGAGGGEQSVRQLALDARGQKDRAQAAQLLVRTVLDVARVDERRDEGPAKGLLERLVEALEDDDQDDVA